MITHRSTTAGLALLLLMAIGAGCSATAAPPQLTDRAFLSVAVTDRGAARALVAGTRIRLDFRATDLGASAGCNSIGGTWSVQGGKLVFEGGGMTEMGCDPERHAQDDWLADFLSSGPAIQLVGDELVLTSGATVLRLADRRVVDPDRALVGPTWVVVSLIGPGGDGGAVSSLPEGVVASLRFHDGGVVDVASGCNQGSGRWALDGTGLRFSDLVTTEMACVGDRGAVEAAVFTVLGAGFVEADIEADQLTLQAPAAQGLQLQAR